MLRCVFLALLATALAVPLSEPKAPRFPEKYTIRGTFRIPYFNIVEPISVFNDGPADNQRVEFYGGVDTTLTVGSTGMAYEIVPRIDHMICMQANVSGPTDTGAARVDLPPFLPDVSTWGYAGITQVRGVDCHTWELQVTNFTKTATYRMFTDAATDAPVQIILDGLNFIQGSHPDVYVLDYDIFTPSVDPSVFEVPDICNSQMEIRDTERVAARIKAMQSRITKMLPPKHGCGESSEFRAFALEHGKRYSSCSEMAKKQNVFEKNLKFITEFNSDENNHRVKMNHFGDWTDEEFKLVMLQKKGARAADSRATRTHQVSANAAPIPPHVDWRDHGAVTPVKDQGVCGSCWTFGTAGSVEGVYAVKHKKLVSVSEQQLVDCAWGYEWSGQGGNLGCDGGFASGALQWIIDNGGVATEESYPYTMQDGWCKAKDHSTNIRVMGYANISDVSTLRDAIATVGPVSVAIDASQPSFRFYASGVYYEPLCKSDMDNLDHEVLAVGYGYEEGQDYTLIKNSWSTYWGDEGYVKMSSKDNNCGVGSQGNYPLVA